MRLVPGAAFAAALVVLNSGFLIAQEQEGASRAVEKGGISVPGWTGKIDANEEKAGQTLNNAKLTQEGDALHVTTGPAVTYWNPANRATGNYTVKATFREPKYMNLNTHPHPYGIFIAGNDLGTRAAKLSVLRRVWQRELHRARIRSRAVSDERQAWRGEPGREQGACGGRTRDSGDRSFRDGQPGQMRDQRDRRGNLR